METTKLFLTLAACTLGIGRTSRNCWGKSLFSIFLANDVLKYRSSQVEGEKSRITHQYHVVILVFLMIIFPLSICRSAPVGPWNGVSAGCYWWIYRVDWCWDGYSSGWGLNGHIWQMVLSRHLPQTSPGFTSAIFMAVSPMSISIDLVIGFPIYQANRRKVALPNCDSSGV